MGNNDSFDDSCLSELVLIINYSLIIFLSALSSHCGRRFRSDVHRSLLWPFEGCRASDEDGEDYGSMGYGSSNKKGGTVHCSMISSSRLIVEYGSLMFGLW